MHDTYTNVCTMYTNVHTYTHATHEHKPVCVHLYNEKFLCKQWLHPCINLGIIQFQSHVAHIYILQVTTTCVHTKCRHIHS